MATSKINNIFAKMIYVISNRYSRHFLIIILFLFIFVFNTFELKALDGNWHEVPSTEYGRQWFDQSNIKKLTKNKLIINSRYKPVFNNQYKNNVIISYTMEIDCNKKLFKDVNINSKEVKESIWRSPNGDLLIDSVINEACKTIF